MNTEQACRGDILIVDDTPENLKLLTRMLEDRGYEVRAVTDGSTALMGIHAQAPDLVLLDINMPGLSGFEVCRHLKEDASTQAIPVIFISAFNEVFDKVTAFSLGGADYIVKPFQVEEVLVRIENQLKICRLQSQLKIQNQELQIAQAELHRALEQEKALNQQIEQMAIVEERNRIARDIHDSLGHALVALNIQLETVQALWQSDPQKACEFLQEAKQLSSEALKAVRESVTTLRDDPLQGQLLEAAIAGLLQEFRHTSSIEPTAHIHITHAISHPINTAAYRIIQEGLTNILKHAEATAVSLHLESTDTALQLRLMDNGKGFQINENATGFGLRGMRERTHSLGGQLTIMSSPQQGCQIVAEFPY